MNSVQRCTAADTSFRNAIIARLTQVMEIEGNKWFEVDSVKYAYEIDKSRWMERFVVMSFMTRVDLKWLIEAVATYPQVFLHELCRLTIYCLG